LGCLASTAVCPQLPITIVTYKRIKADVRC
jgi:hypothetical protein